MGASGWAASSNCETWVEDPRVGERRRARSEEAVEEVRRRVREADDLVRRLAIELEVELGLGSTVVPFGKEFQLAPPEVSFGERGASDARGSLTAVLTAKIMVRVPRYCRSAADAETGATALILRHSRER